jgi:6-phosphogluconolactonase
MKLFCITILTFAIMSLSSESSAQQKTLLLVGTYTEKEDQGINLLGFSGSGQLKEISLAAQVEDPSFVIANKAGNLVFAAEETEGDRGGKVTSFSLNRENGNLTKINSVYSEGNGPCYISLDPEEKNIVVGNYDGGNLSVIPVNENGELMASIQTIQHEGSSVNKERQEAPHVHSVVFHPWENMLFVGDLGTDEVVAYHYEANKSLPLTRAYSIKTEPGTGPRHLIFNESGKYMYLIHELTGDVGVYQEGDQQYEHLANYPLYDEGFDGEQGGAEIRLSKDGKFLYASNRGEVNKISVFGIQENGELSLVQRVSVEGENPRNFILSPGEDFLIVANQGSDKLVVFERDKKNGKISPTDQSQQIPKPVYLYFIE